MPGAGGCVRVLVGGAAEGAVEGWRAAGRTLNKLDRKGAWGAGLPALVPGACAADWSPQVVCVSPAGAATARRPTRSRPTAGAAMRAAATAASRPRRGPH